MKINELGKAIVGSRGYLNNFGTFWIGNFGTLHQDSKLNKPITEQTSQYLKYCNTRSDYHTKLWVFIYSKLSGPINEP